MTARMLLSILRCSDLAPRQCPVRKFQGIPLHELREQYAASATSALDIRVVSFSLACQQGINQVNAPDAMFLRDFACLTSVFHKHANEA